MRRLIVLMVVGLGLALGVAVADTPTTITRDGVVLTIPQEKRAEVIGDRLRCLVCQNETVENSQAGLAKQFRGIIRRRVVLHDTNQQIVDFMVQRYGIFVLLKPPLIPLTWLLWFSPAIALVLGLLVLILARRRKQARPPPLSPDERDRLKELLS
jgi:cytochrome c-type biogenesis protein CcmH